MEKLYSTGEFAKIAGVTLRTIRYYDKIGLLKPTKILENGYRKYCNNDLITLQKILSLKELGFSLEEIYPLIQDNDKDSFKKSIVLQTNLINQKIQKLTALKESLKATEKILTKNEIAWDKIIELIKLSSIKEEIINHYINDKNLETRITLHDTFSINKQGWFLWLFEQIDFSTVYRLLELGCGNGKLWQYNSYNLRNREIFLSDISNGMLEKAKQNLGNDYNYLNIDCQNIPFKNNYFDTIIANHVIFYLKNPHLGLSEIT
ncbi:MerR family transcriptional regulator, partial [Thomasclavelia cocleata]